MNIYYELSDNAADRYGHKYWTEYLDSGIHFRSIRGLDLTRCSDRIWREDDKKIIYIKHRYVPISTPVDLQEFGWIKLKSKNIV
jgi:hypothetical protein